MGRSREHAIEEGRHRGRRETMALSELMERVREPLERRTQEAGFAIRVAVTEADASVTVDADALAQVLFGLVDNACKYATDGERLIEVSAARAADDLEFCVRDHGTGIPAAHQRTVFRPFFHTRRNDKYERKIVTDLNADDNDESDKQRTANNNAKTVGSNDERRPTKSDLLHHCRKE